MSSFSRRLTAESLEGRRLLAFGVLQETGDFLAEVERLKQQAFEKDSNAYVAPSAAELAEFESLAVNLINGDLAEAISLASGLDYEIVEFTDSLSSSTLFGLREQLVNGQQTRGWGSYFLNLSFQADTLVEVPQPLFDTNTWEIAGNAFLQAESRGFLLAGAHRNANGPGTADVAHLSDSIFQTVHTAWVGSGGTSAWQIHGFDLDNHPSFPTGIDLISSHGDGTITSAMTDLDGRFEAAGFDGFTYNTLDPSVAVNGQVNDGVDGSTFSALAGSTNVQGIHSRGAGGDFVHVELEQSIRFDATSRDVAASLIGESLSVEAAFFVTATEFNADHTQLKVHFGEAVATSSLSADDLSIDGVAAIAVHVVDSDTVAFDLPSLDVGSHSISITPGAMNSVSLLDVNEFHAFFEIDQADPPASGTKFFVVDTAEDSTYEYDASGQVVDSYSLAAGNTMPRGAASNLEGDTVWVIDNDDYVYVYDASGNLLGDWKASGLSKPEGIATDGIDIWVVDRGTDRIYFFANGASHRSGTVGATASFGLGAGNKNPRGITTDGTSLWVVNWSTSSSEKVFKYAVNGTLSGNWTIDPRNSSPRGITTDPADPDNLWIVDNGTDSIYQYLGAGQRTSGSQNADAVFALLSSNPQAIADPPPAIDSSQSTDDVSTAPPNLESGEVVDDLKWYDESFDDLEDDDLEDDDHGDTDDDDVGFDRLEPRLKKHELAEHAISVRDSAERQVDRR